MGRRAVILAVSALLATGIPAAPAVADEGLIPVVTIPGPSGPSPSNVLMAAGNGRFLVGGPALIDADGHSVARYDGSWALAPGSELRSDGFAVLRSGGEVLVVELGTGGSTLHTDPGPGTYVGPDGWVETRTGGTVDHYVHRAWDGSETELVRVTGTGVRVDRGRALTWGREGGLHVVDIASGDGYSIPGVPGDSQWRTNERGISWATVTQAHEAPAVRQWCHADWGQTTGNCVDYVWDRPAGTPRTVLPGSTALFVAGQDGVSVLTEGSWHLVPTPVGSVASGCRINNDEVVCLLKGPQQWGLWRVTDQAVGSVVPIPDDPQRTTSASLTPTALYGTDDRRLFWPEQGVWRHALDEDAAPVPMGPGRTVLAQGARSVVGTQWYLDDQPGVEMTAFAVSAISGPYAVATSTDWYEQAVLGTQGERLYGPARRIHAIFGTNVLETGGVFDLTTGRLLHETWGEPGAKLWGPWILDARSVRNWRTGVGAELAVPYQHFGSERWLGDGIAVVQGLGDDGGPLALVYDLSRLRSGEPLEPELSVAGRVLALDGDRIAWTQPDITRFAAPDGDIHISTLPFGGRSAPWFLGASGATSGISTASPWLVSFDFTRDVVAGTIEVRDWTGRLVRTLATPPSQAGIVRDVTWDGRDDSGAAVADGPYTWELLTTDELGRIARASDSGSAVTGQFTVGTGVVRLAAAAPKFVDACGDHADTYTLAAAQSYEYRIGATVRHPGTYTVRSGGQLTITAHARPGFQLTGTTSWTFKPSPELCPISLPFPLTYYDPPGTANDTYTLPGPSPHVLGWMVNGKLTPAGTYKARGSYSFEPLAERGYRTFATIVEFTNEPHPTPPVVTTPPFDVYTTEGTHLLNGRTWRTVCEPYSQTKRCRTTIMASTVVEESGRFKVVNDWVFNNLTYLPMPRSLWAGNPVGGNGKVDADISWTAADGRQWRTECDTDVTGRNGCRSYTRTSLIATVKVAGGGTQYRWESRWVLNNMVRFSQK